MIIVITGFAQKPVHNFSLTGTIEGKADGYIYLDRMDISTGSRITDSTLVNNGTFVFRGTIGEPLAVVISDGKIYVRDNPNVANFFIDKADMTISLKWGNFKDYKLTGSTMNDEMSTYMKLLGPDSKNSEAIGSEYIKAHPDSYLSSFILMMGMSRMTAEELQEKLDKLSDRVKEGSSAKSILKEISIKRGVAPGSVATPFTSTDINGKSLSLSDFKGKYIILDFWASWCVPCRQGNPHLKALYEKYNSKGLEVICVSDDDSNPDKWRRAVEKDSIGMFHHILRGLKVLPGYQFDRTNSISDKYGVHSLPTKFLIDREGKIVGCFDAEEMDNKLKAIFE